MKRSNHKTINIGAVLAVASLALGWAGMAAGGEFPATGQTTCWNSAGFVISCEDTGQDGDIQAGATLNYNDEGDGTIEDKVTDLVWEKKSDEEAVNDNDNTTFPHDKDNVYTWDQAFDYIATLNNSCANDETVDCSVNGDADCAGVGGECGFAGHRGWRLPNYKELTSILNLENFNPAVSLAFHNSCDPGDTVTDGSCTAASGYWSSTTSPTTPSSRGACISATASWTRSIRTSSSTSGGCVAARHSRSLDHLSHLII